MLPVVDVIGFRRGEARSRHIDHTSRRGASCRRRAPFIGLSGTQGEGGGGGVRQVERVGEVKATVACWQQAISALYFIHDEECALIVNKVSQSLSTQYKLKVSDRSTPRRFDR